MTSPRSILLLAGMAVSLSAETLFQPDLLPTAGYHQEIYFPNEYTQSFAATEPSLNLKRSFLPSVGFQAAAGNLFQEPAAFAVNLFTPNTVQQPAETPGQVENYRKALEEEAREAEKAENRVNTDFHSGIGGLLFHHDVPRSYVDVKVTRGKDFKYSYSI